MKKVLYIDPQSGDNLAMYDYELLSRIRNYDITYIHSRTYDYEKLTNVKSNAIFSYTTKTNSISKGFSYCLSLIKLMRIIKSTKPDIIHIQWFRLPKLEYLFYKHFKKKFNFKLVHTVHNLLPHVSKKSDYSDYARLYSLCDGLIVHTKTARKNLISQFNLKNKVITAPHGPLKFKLTDKEITEKIFELKFKYKIKAKYIVTMLGYQSLYKGTDLAIEAWRKSSSLSNNKEICLIIAGQNRDFKTTSQNSDNNITIINSRLSDLEFASFMKMSSVVLLPYRNIEQSGVLLSIVTEKIPYCTTQVGELTKPFEYGDVGWTIESPSIEAVQTKLEEIFMNLSEIEKKKNNNLAWTKIQEHYSWDKAAELTTKLYTELA